MTLAFSARGSPTVWEAVSAPAAGRDSEVLSLANDT